MPRHADGTPGSGRRRGIQTDRQAFFKPCRLIYQLLEGQAPIVLVADGRGDFQSLRARRLLGA